MTGRIKVEFKSLERPEGGEVVVFADDALSVSAAAAAWLGEAGLALVQRAAQIEKFKGAARSTLVLAAPQGIAADRLVVVGLGAAKDIPATDWARLGGAVLGKIAGAQAHILFDLPGDFSPSPEAAGDFSLGLRLRAYRFDRYKTKKKEEDEQEASPAEVVVHLAGPDAARAARKAAKAVAEGVCLARDLVNEPANVLYPEEFARRAGELAKLDVAVEVLGEKELKALGFGALVAVGQGSRAESQVVVLRWNGAGADEKPVAFVGKGVTFDTGGISIKPAANMEDMKGDMAGAAAVIGLIHALATRKAKVNAVGVVGLVENMPDGKAQRPGDIVTSLSGQTIEVINTDAEGRLVLADVLWYTQARFQPQFIVNLATLTGAIIVALGQENAGLFSNSDELAARLGEAGKATGETVWRLPLQPEYDKLIDSKVADVKNTGGRNAGSITAAQFLKRFVNDAPWAHLDIAGTGMAAKQTDTNRSWGSGWGVRLLDRLVRDHYEAR
ncbi:leucyl aminopeptidase [Pseudochelatococcus lubricantis]|uniref:Probable cytosol aminopeptidase n=1 Tax=Pseudochelatococcus lubricantis TaxID=1538102 RepID=A0ABX0UXA0_9HYPH|nr:leucyl aminopeptidase [Pseudochelatococcus lubricantis]NIJ57372.1 leucyl aminopeptidase [Pseudochelatococcus lubricantis]